MNIVIYSYNFFPQADAESYCATRFASALFRAGHNVQVITMDWPMQVSEDSYKALVAEGLKITRLPFSNKKNTPLKALFWYGHKSQMAVDVSESVRAVKKALKSLSKPILITRTHPVMSTMVGLKARKYAYKWIAHFSDPIPWLGYANTFGHKLLRRLEKNIINKAFINADGISITCNHVRKYFSSEYKKSFDQSKVFLTTHIGDNRLNLKKQIKQNIPVRSILLHPGSIFKDRGGCIVPQVMKSLWHENIDCKFVQVGSVDSALQNDLVNTENIEIIDTNSIEKSIELVNQAKAIFIPDFESDFEYSPFLLSKFVYQIMEDKPLVLYSKKDSEMHDYADQYPEAGIFWAEIGNIESLKRAIKAAMECDNTTIDRTQIRKCFSEENIVNTFNNAIKKLINCNNI